MSSALQLLDRPELRAEALDALSHHVEGRIPGILAALETATADRAHALVAALARMDRPDACAALGVALSVDRIQARRAAAAALSAVCTDLGRALLAAAADDPDGEVRRLAALTFGGR